MKAVTIYAPPEILREGWYKIRISERKLGGERGGEGLPFSLLQLNTV